MFSISIFNFSAKPENYLDPPFELTERNYFLVESREAVIVLEPETYDELISLKPERETEANRINQAIKLFDEGRNPQNSSIIIKTCKNRVATWRLNNDVRYISIFNLCRDIQKTTPHIMFMAEDANEIIGWLAMFNKIKNFEQNIFIEGWEQKENCSLQCC